MTANFAAYLTERCSSETRLIEASKGDHVADVPSAVQRYAAQFADALSPGDRLMLRVRLDPDSALAYLGAIYAGLVPVPIDATARKDAILRASRAAGASAIWSPPGKPAPDEVLAELPAVQASRDGAFEPMAHPAEVAPDDVAVWMMTSGSTGAPRFVYVTHENLRVNTEDIVTSQRLDHAPGERAMLVLPLSYCFGTSVLHSHLAVGGGVVFDRRLMFPDRVLDAITDHDCTTFAGVPSVYKVLKHRSNLQKKALPTLRRFIQAGGRLDPESIQTLRGWQPEVDFYVMYGQTEATARLTCLPPERLDDRLGSAGLPLERVTLEIRTDDGEPLPANSPGVIFAHGPSICPTSPDAPAPPDGGRWLNTGDLGYVDDEGFLWITGRQSEFMKVRGVRVGFHEMEDKVRALDGVQEAAVCRMTHPEAGEIPGVVVVPTSWDPEQAADVAKAIQGQLPKLWMCRTVVAVERLPVGARGKVNRAAVEALVREEQDGSGRT